MHRSPSANTPRQASCFGAKIRRNPEFLLKICLVLGGGTARNVRVKLWLYIVFLALIGHFSIRLEFLSRGSSVAKLFYCLHKLRYCYHWWRRRLRNDLTQCSIVRAWCTSLRGDLYVMRLQAVTVFCSFSNLFYYLSEQRWGFPNESNRFELAVTIKTARIHSKRGHWLAHLLPRMTKIVYGSMIFCKKFNLWSAFNWPYKVVLLIKNVNGP